MNNFYSLLIAFTFFTLFHKRSFSQEEQPLRIEIEAKASSGQYNIVPVGKEGLILFYESDEREKGNKSWYFTKYNENFKEVWNKKFPVNSSLDFIRYYYNNSELLYVLLAEVVRSSAKSPGIEIARNYQVISINIVNGSVSSVAGDIPVKFTPTDFKVTDENVFFSGFTRPTNMQVCMRTMFIYATCCIPIFLGGLEFKYQPVLFHINLKNQKKEMMALNYPGSAGIVSLGINDKTENIAATIKHRPAKKEFNLYLKEFSSDGKTLSNFKIEPGGTNELLTGKILNLGKDEKLIIGTYSSSAEKQPFGVRMQMAMYGTTSELRSEGFYISRFNGSRQEYIQYHPFSKFENLFSGKQKEQIKKAEKQGKEINVNYFNLLIHDIIVDEDQYIMIAEAYHPEYHTEYRYVYTTNGMQMQAVRVFDGYRYDYAIVAGFDESGKMLWDNIFEIADILSFNLKERIKVIGNPDMLTLVYSQGGSIKSKVISGGKVVEEKEKTKIETTYSDDKVKANYNSDLDYWYDNYFIAYGYQKIKADKEGKEKGEKRKRNVFYFNKISYE